jgi:hypothetical protein
VVRMIMTEVRIINAVSNRQVFADNAVWLRTSALRVAISTDRSSASLPLGTAFVMNSSAVPSTDHSASTRGLASRGETPSHSTHRFVTNSKFGCGSLIRGSRPVDRAKKKLPKRSRWWLLPNG